MKRSFLFPPVALLLVIAGGAEAQNPKAAPLYETVELSAGFTPDPTSRTLQAGGEDDVEVTGTGSCAGYINASAPDFNLRYEAGITNLYIYARSDEDITLVVNDPKGDWYCSDDWDGTDPMVDFQDPVSGNYNIWVGTYSEGETQEATLYFTEILPDEVNGSDDETGDLPDIGADPIYETIELTAGFGAGISRELRAGGSDRNNVDGDGCSGYINASAPDFDLNYTAGQKLPLIIYATSDEDITLVVNDADGTWHCSDDDDGTNPLIRLNTPPSGNYNIWVGTYAEGEMQDAELFISERAPW